MDESEHLQLIAGMYATVAAGDVHTRMNYIGLLLSTLREWNEKYKVAVTMSDTDKLQRYLSTFVYDLANQIDAVVHAKTHNFSSGQPDRKVFNQIAGDYRKILDFLDRHESGEQVHLAVCVLNRADLRFASHLYRQANGAYASMLTGKPDGAEGCFDLVQQCMEKINAVLYRNDILQMNSGDWIKAVEKSSPKSEPVRGKS